MQATHDVLIQLDPADRDRLILALATAIARVYKERSGGDISIMESIKGALAAEKAIDCRDLRNSSDDLA